MESRFGKLLREEREIAGLSLRGLAIAAGLNPGYLSRLESGEITPREDNMLKIADALADLVGDRRATQEQFRARFAEAAGRVPVGENTVDRIKSDFAALLNEKDLQPHQIESALEVVSTTTMLRILRGEEPLRILGIDQLDQVDAALREHEEIAVLPETSHEFAAGSRASIRIEGPLDDEQQKQLRLLAELIRTIVARPKL